MTKKKIVLASISAVMIGVVGLLFSSDSKANDGSWHRNLNTINATTLLTQKDKGVVTFQGSGSNNSTPTFYSEQGNEQPTSLQLSRLINDRAVDRNGNLFGFDSASTSIVALQKDGSELWRHSVSETSCSDPSVVIRKVALGRNGNLFVVFNERSTTCSGADVRLKIFTPEGELLLNKKMTTFDGNTSWADVYDRGVVIRQSSTRTLHYVTYEGTELPAVQLNFQAIDSPIAPVIDVDGNVYFYIQSSANTSCMRQQMGKHILAYNKDGLKGSYNFSSCSLVEGHASMRATPTGVALVGKTTTKNNQSKWLITLNQQGKLIKKTTLPSTEDGMIHQDTPPFIDPQLYADTQGNLIIVRQYRPQEGMQYHGVYITIINPEGTVQRKLNTTQFAGMEGFELQDLGLSNNTLYLITRQCPMQQGVCTNTAPNSSSHIYHLHVNGLGLDYPRGAFLQDPPEQNPNPNPPEEPELLTVNAIGDSFISGEGIPPFMPEEKDERKKCHRSFDAWPRQVTAISELNLHLTEFAACSGATSQDMITGSDKQPKQVDSTSINPNADIILVSAGGNDVKFVQYAIRCLLTSCLIEQDAMMNRINNELVPKLETLYQEIRTINPDAAIYVMGYPIMIPQHYCNPLSFSESLLLQTLELATANPAAFSTIATFAYYSDMSAEDLIAMYTKWGFSMDDEEAIATNLVTHRLNNRIIEATQGFDNIWFVNPNGLDSPFRDRHICASDELGSYFNKVVWPPNIVYSFHPNSKGAIAYTNIFKQYYLSTQ